MMFDVQPVSGPDAYAASQFSKPMAAFVRTASGLGLRKPHFQKTYLVTGEEARELERSLAPKPDEAVQKAEDPDKDLPIAPSAAPYIVYRMLREANEKFAAGFTLEKYREQVKAVEGALSSNIQEGKCGEGKFVYRAELPQDRVAIVVTHSLICHLAGREGAGAYVIPDRNKYFNILSQAIDVPKKQEDEKPGFMRVPLRNYVPFVKTWAI